MVSIVCINWYSLLHSVFFFCYLLGITGVKHRCSHQFTPIVENWLNSQTLNLLAVELLYLAFSLCLLRYPKILGDDEKLTQSPFGIIQDPLRDLLNPAIDPTSKSQTPLGSRKRKLETSCQTPSQPLVQQQRTPTPPSTQSQPPQKQQAAEQEHDCTQQLESVSFSLPCLLLALSLLLKAAKKNNG